MYDIMWNLLHNHYIGVYQLILKDRYKGFNFLRKGLKNNLKSFFLKNSPFAKRKPCAKCIFCQALSGESLALSGQPLHLKLIWSAKLAKAELSLFQFDMNLAKQWPDR